MFILCRNQHKQIRKNLEVKMSEETKKCPYCGKEILKDAKKCKYCKAWLERDYSVSNLQSIVENYIVQTPLKTQFIKTKDNITSELLSESKITPKNGELG